MVKRAQKIIYEKLVFTPRGIRFYYLIDGEPYSFFTSLDHFDKKLTPEIYTVAAHIGLSYLLDLCIICLPKLIVIKAIKLSSPQLNFWKWVYQNIAIERSYTEKHPRLYFKDAKWTSPSGPSFSKVSEKPNSDKLCIAVSGGKESLSALKMFKSYPDLKLLMLDYIGKNSFYLHRVYDKLRKKYPYILVKTDVTHTEKLCQKYKCIDYNVAVISQIIFYTMLYSDDINYLAIGNEYTACFCNTLYLGEPVNHQFDKSFKYANRVNQYIHRYLNKDFTYFSPFFDFYEYKIVDYFFKNNDNLDVWTSCNDSSPRNNFCAKCEKCAFIYMVSLAFVDKKFLGRYFPTNPMLNLKLCKPLISPEGIKPTDCFGEKEEVWLALSKVIADKKDTTSPVIKYFMEEVYPKVKNKLPTVEESVTSPHLNHKYIPKIFYKLITREMSS